MFFYLIVDAHNHASLHGRGEIISSQKNVGKKTIKNLHNRDRALFFLLQLHKADP